MPTEKDTGCWVGGGLTFKGGVGRFRGGYYLRGESWPQFANPVYVP